MSPRRATSSSARTTLSRPPRPLRRPRRRSSEEELRALGLGYRARYVRDTAALVVGKGPGWLESLRSLPRAEAQAALLELPGVGRKVADCVALFSLDQTEAIPVDVHVWNIACRDYDPALSASKSLTPAIYDRVGDLFRTRYGPHAGWAHSALFAAELPAFSRRLPAERQEEMAEFRAQERLRSAEKRSGGGERQWLGRGGHACGRPRASVAVAELGAQARREPS